MSDLFHEGVPSEYLQQVFDVMRRAHWHRFQVLTKRAERLAELSPALPWAPHIWMGVSVESDKYRDRIEHLRGTTAHIKFLSLEPLLGPLGGLDLTDIDWVIVGGESGPKARPMDPSWVTDLRDQCLRANVPFFFKQWGGTNKKRTGRLLDGRTWDELPRRAAGPQTETHLHRPSNAESLAIDDINHPAPRKETGTMNPFHKRIREVGT